MSGLIDDPLEEEERRAAKLAAARKKLKTFRATRASAQSSAQSSASSTSRPHSRTPSASLSGPLFPSNADNCPSSPRRTGSHSSSGSKGKAKAEELDSNCAEGYGAKGHAHRRSRSRAGHAHMRSPSSLGSPSKMSRKSVMGVFELPLPAADLEGLTAKLAVSFQDDPGRPLGTGLALPNEIITTPATPLLDPPEHDPFFSSPIRNVREPENEEATRSRLSTFSFGARPPASRSPSPTTRLGQPFLPSLALRAQDLSSSSLPPFSPPTSSASAPGGLNLAHFTPNSRPPSLLLTKPTPSPLVPPPAQRGPSPTSPSASPSSPSTPARAKRHSHTRSSSISLPNMKLGRPTSLGIPSSPSFPSSPSSPSASSTNPRQSGPIHGTRLKFEPSGRGAEAEKEKDESRRKALEKLTGTSATPSPRFSPREEVREEIALPDLDDDDDGEVSTTSSVQPLSGVLTSSTFSFGRPNSLTMPALSSASSSATSAASPGSSPFWPSPEETSPMERWSPFGAFRDDGLGITLDYPKRGSLTGGLSMLAQVEEVDEGEEQEEEDAEHADEDDEDFPGHEAEDVTAVTTDFPLRKDLASPQPSSGEPVSAAAETTPHGLRELHLLSGSSRSADSADSVRTFPFPRPSSGSCTSTSPTKGYGAIGRGRPRPLSGIVNVPLPPIDVGSTSTPGPAPRATPKSAKSQTRRRPLGSGSRGSSISYKKDSESSASTSSRDWSAGSKVGSPPLGTFETQMGSPPSFGFGSPKFGGWGNMARGANRPCPRPKILVGLGLDSRGAGRILGEVEEAEEEEAWSFDRSRGPSGTIRGFASSMAREGSQADNHELDMPIDEASMRNLHHEEAADDHVTHWRDRQLEVVIERDALKEDVQLLRARCLEMEERLEAEKREVAVLRERVRKLGDRLSDVSISQAPRTAAPDAAAMAEMRQQFFSLTASLERERREKEDALDQLAALQSRYDAERAANGVQRSAWGQLQPMFGVPSAVVTPATPTLLTSPPTAFPPFDSTLPSTSHILPETDPNRNRMQAWGFPSGPISSKTPSKRDSFFGLSSVRMPVPVEHEAEERECAGVDLPPISLDGAMEKLVTPRSFSQTSPFQRAVSEPIRTLRTLRGQGVDIQDRGHASPAVGVGAGAGIARSTSLTLKSTLSESASSATSSALSFLSGYLSLSRSPSKATSTTALSAPSSPEESMSSLASMEIGSSSNWGQQLSVEGAQEERKGVDMRGSCGCCVGDVMEF